MSAQLGSIRVTRFKKKHASQVVWFSENRKYVIALECDAYFLDSWYRYFPTLLHKEGKIFARLQSTQNMTPICIEVTSEKYFHVNFLNRNENEHLQAILNGNKNIMKIKSYKQITKHFIYNLHCRIGFRNWFLV